MIQVSEISKCFGDDAVAVDNVSFTVDEGDFFVLLGASGSGKTTTLRILAALEHPDVGQIRMDDVVVFASGEGRAHTLGPERRPIAMMFQSYALWPHMTVGRNIEFPLRHSRRRIPKEQIRRRIDEALELMQIGDLRARPISTLSGGQQQRVALARSLAQEPKILLMDEPLSNLDARLRAQLRVDLKELTKRLGITTVYVTHDQVEAMVMGDRIGVMRQGRLLQVGSPVEVYESPQSIHVADFMGESNRLTARVRRIESQSVMLETPAGRLRGCVTGRVEVGQEVDVSVRAECIHIGPPDADQGLDATIRSSVSLGETHSYQAILADGTVVDVRRSGHQEWPVGHAVSLTMRPDDVNVFPRDVQGSDT